MKTVTGEEPKAGGIAWHGIKGSVFSLEIRVSD